jgi:FKBP-type peptidyl-prolyl cis-trans isomerase
MLALVAAAALSADELAAAKTAPAAVTVDVYSGPRDCPDESKVQPGNRILLHFTGSIDKSSATGIPGKTFESTRDGDSQPVDMTVGIGKVIKGEIVFHERFRHIIACIEMIQMI